MDKLFYILSLIRLKKNKDKPNMTLYRYIDHLKNYILRMNFYNKIKFNHHKSYITTYINLFNIVIS